jgi:hypothetical protein
MNVVDGGKVAGDGDKVGGPVVLGALDDDGDNPFGLLWLTRSKRLYWIDWSLLRDNDDSART